MYNVVILDGALAPQFRDPVFYIYWFLGGYAMHSSEDDDHLYIWLNNDTRYSRRKASYYQCD